MTSLPDSIATALKFQIENQIDRRRIALGDLPDAVLTQEPGGGCNHILGICQHLVELRMFCLKLLGQEPQGLGNPKDLTDLPALQTALDTAEAQLLSAIANYDASTWQTTPSTHFPEGPWIEESTLTRVSRPLNDFANHLGSIRTIRRIAGHPLQETQ